MSGFNAAQAAAPRRGRVVAGLLGLAQLGYAHWFFGNLYEAMVKVPDLLASRDSHRDSGQAVSPLVAGSPARYYIASAPATLPAAFAAVVFGWDGRDSRPWLAATATCSVIGGAATIYLVRAVNMKLFFGRQLVTADERELLLRTWYQVNAVRLVATSGAWLAAHKARSLLPR